MDSVIALTMTAASLGFIHTLLGPDHYVPFVALSRSNGWSQKKTLWIAGICGLAHCLSSVLLGFLGIGLGVFVGSLESVEAVRGDVASYLMIAFGTAYLVWAIRNLVKNKKHHHTHSHGAFAHSHTHNHSGEHVHCHEKKSRNVFWAVFIVFLFGPCEPLIPLLMYPAAKLNWMTTAIVAGVFTLVTISTMLTAVYIGTKGLEIFKFPRLSKYTDVLASSAIIACGVLIVLGL